MTQPRWEHQQRELDEYADAEARALLWTMRTGKSRAIVDLACKSYVDGRIDGVVVLAPNGVHANWTRREIPRHTWSDVPTSTHTWVSSRAARDKLALRDFVRPDETTLRWFSVNSEALTSVESVHKAIRAFVASCDGRVLLAVDESDDFRRPSAKRTTRVRHLARYCGMRRIMTGTSVLNSPLHAFSQFEILQREALGFRRFEDFKNRYARMGLRRRRGGDRSYPVVEEYINQEELRERISRFSSVVLRDEVRDMPALLEIARPVALSDAQRRVYTQLSEEWLQEMGVGGLPEEVPDAGVRMLKLQQVLGGFVIDAHGNVHSVDDSPPRLDAMEREVLGTLPGKSIVWCRFQEDIRRVVARLEGLGLTVAQYHGQRKDRASDLQRFQEDPDCSVLVGQPQAGGRGLDMSVARLILWYSYSHDAISRNQASERATAIGGHDVAMVSLYVPGCVDIGTLDSIDDKEATADFLTGSGLRDLLANGPLL